MSFASRRTTRTLFPNPMLAIATHSRAVAACRPIVAVALTTLAALPLWAESTCEAVPESRRAECEKVLDCMTIEDGNVRRACIEAAQRTEQPAPIPEPAEEPQQHLDQPPEPKPPQELEPEQLLKPDPREEAREPPTLEERTVSLGGRQSAPAHGERQRPSPELSPPREKFTANISRIHQSILDRQVIALDNSYVFVSDQASPARLQVGDTVDVERRKSRFRASRTWRIVGANRHTIEAFRIRCENDDISADDRRRCEQMLDR